MSRTSLGRAALVRRRERRHHPVPALVLAVLSIGPSLAPRHADAEPQAKDPAKSVSPARAEACRDLHHVTIERAMAGALRKLEQPQCLALLDEFKDGSGKPLASNLANWQRTAVDYLRTTPFRDGATHSPCRSGKSALFSVVGMRPVFVCPSFKKDAERDPWAAENWLIHEMLHTLGLGENPPSSREITERVNQLCQ